MIKPNAVPAIIVTVALLILLFAVTVHPSKVIGDSKRPAQTEPHFRWVDDSSNNVRCYIWGDRARVSYHAMSCVPLQRGGR